MELGWGEHLKKEDKISRKTAKVADLCRVNRNSVEGNHKKLKHERSDLRTLN